MLLCWGEQSARGFRVQDGSFVSQGGDAVTPELLDLGDSPGPVLDLCAGTGLLSFVREDGGAWIIRSQSSGDRGWTRARQKRVQWKEKVQAVSCTEDTLLLLSRQGQVLCVPPHVPPRTFEAFHGLAVAQISCGLQHCLALTKDGEVFGWGQDTRGQLGLGRSGPGSSSPVPMRSLSSLPLVQVSAGGEHSLALTVSGGVFSWGRNCSGQLGLGDSDDRHSPAQILRLNMKKVCSVSCGEKHTAVLTKDGAVFTFGSGEQGQLGHNSFREEMRPRLVAELWGARVRAVACGSLHTVVLTDTQRIYWFGGRGQRGDDGAAVPLPVPLPEEHTGALVIRKIFAGGLCSYAAWDSEEIDRSEQTSGVTIPLLSDLLSKWTSDLEPWKKTKREIRKTFSSASSLNRSFLDPRKHFETSSKLCGLDLSAAHESFSKLLHKPKVLEEVESASLSLVRSLSPSPVGAESLRVYLLLTEILHVLHQHQTSEENMRTTLVEALAAAVLRLPQESIHALGEWWSSLPYSTRVRHVLVWKQAAPYVSSLSASRSLLKVLQIFHNRNIKSRGLNRIPESVFTVPVPPEMIMQTVLWRCAPFVLNEEPILCSFPFLMALDTRHQALLMNNHFIMISNSIDRDWPFWFFYAQTFDWERHVELDLPDICSRKFPLNLRRECVMEDTFSQLSTSDHTLFQRPLEVHFNGVCSYDKVNQKDFFHLVFHEMISADSGMFMFNDSATLVWFSSRATAPLHHFHLFGLLCGLAVFNLHLVFLPFPLALFKKLLGATPSLDDLCQLSPCTGQSLRCLLEDYSDDVIQSLDMDFRIHWDGTEVELDPQNPDRAVTTHNKEEFVEAFVQHVFSSSVQREFEEFRRGFFTVADQHTVALFSPEELRTVMVGQEEDWSKLKQNTVYEGVFHQSHRTIRMFWEVFDELTEEQRKALLWFITGFERLPILDVDLKIKIKGLSNSKKNLPEDDYFPQSHTCLNTLELPQYSDRTLMKSRLTEALAQICPGPDHRDPADSSVDVLQYDYD